MGTGVDINNKSGLCDTTWSRGIGYVGWSIGDCHELPQQVFAGAASRGARFLEMDSVEAADEFEDHSLDFVYIDAEHNDRVALDLKAWEPKLRKGGILAGHDFGIDWKDVPHFVLERRCASATNNKNLFLGVDSVYWWYP